MSREHGGKYRPYQYVPRPNLDNSMPADGNPKPHWNYSRVDPEYVLPDEIQESKVQSARSRADITTRLLERIMKLPEHVRRRIYVNLFVLWAPSQQYSILSSLDPRAASGIVAFARLNKNQLRLREEPDKVHQYEDFDTKYGVLDYFKKAEHQHMVDFVNVLIGLEQTVIKTGICKGQKFETFGMLRDFYSWSWDTLILDLDTSWRPHRGYVGGLSTWVEEDYGPDLTATQWLNNRAQYHRYIRHISLDICMTEIKEYGVSPEQWKYDTLFVGPISAPVHWHLHPACGVLADTLPNLHSIRLFVDVDREGFHSTMRDEKFRLAKAVRSLKPVQIFEVYVGSMYCGDEKDRVRNVEKEEALRLLVMPDSPTAEIKSTIAHINMPNVKSELNFECLESIGWMAMEDEERNISYEVADFLLVAD